MAFGCEFRFESGNEKLSPDYPNINRFTFRTDTPDSKGWMQESKVSEDLFSFVGMKIDKFGNIKGYYTFRIKARKSPYPRWKAWLRFRYRYGIDK